MSSPISGAWWSNTLEEFVPAAVSDEIDPRRGRNRAEPRMRQSVRLTYRKRSISRRLTKVSAASLRTDRRQVTRNRARKPSITALCDLRRFGWSDGDILFVLTNATNGIADHIFDQKQREPLEQASRVIIWT